MPAPVRELFNLAAPALAVVDDDPEALAVSIKGFASVMSKEDRSGDLVPPEEFRVKQFMAAPTVFVNHKPWIDPMGNGVSVGRPVELYSAKLAPIEGDSENWAVIDVDTRKQRNTYPKDKVPNLKAGDRGLFTVIEVNEPDVVSRVRRGEFQAFSWRGLTSVEFIVDQKSNLPRRTFTDIDLFEISLVNIPDEPSSTFVIGKKLNGKFSVSGNEIPTNLAVYSLHLQKSRFETEGIAREYMKAHNFVGRTSRR